MVKILSLVLLVSSLFPFNVNAGVVTDRLIVAMASSVSQTEAAAFIQMLNRFDRKDISGSERTLQTEMDKLISSKKEVFIKAFLTSISKEVEKRSFENEDHLKELENLYNNFLRAICLMYPNLKPMYYDEPESDRSILSLGALEYLINRASKQADEYATLPSRTLYTTYDPLDETKKDRGRAYEGLENIFKKLDEIQTEEDRIILVRHTVTVPSKPHISPIFVHLTKTQMQVITLDTLGVPYHTKLYKKGGLYEKERLMFSEYITKQINKNRNFKHQVTVYAQKVCRQDDMTSCPVMSLEDVFAYQKFDFLSFLSSLSSQNIHKLTDEESLVQGKTVDLNVFDILPPQFMKTMQLLLKNEDRKKYEILAKACNFASAELEPLNAHMKTFVLDLKAGMKEVKLNFYGRSLFFQYSKILIEDFLNPT
jgi:hypothetical protein